MAGNKLSLDADPGDRGWFVYDAMLDLVASCTLPGVLSGGSGGPFGQSYLAES